MELGVTMVAQAANSAASARFFMSGISLLRRVALTCRALCLALLFLLSAGVLCQRADAGTPPIPALPNLYNTGVDDAHNLLGDGVYDTHYDGFALPNGVAPLAGNEWMPNGTTSRWISKTLRAYPNRRRQPAWRTLWATTRGCLYKQIYRRGNPCGCPIRMGS